MDESGKRFSVSRLELPSRIAHNVQGKGNIVIGHWKQSILVIWRETCQRARRMLPRKVAFSIHWYGNFRQDFETFENDLLGWIMYELMNNRDNKLACILKVKNV